MKSQCLQVKDDYRFILHFSGGSLGGSVVQRLTSGVARVAVACLPQTHTSSCLPITSKIFEKLIIEMHYKTHDWPKWLISSLLLLPYAVLFLHIADARMHRSSIQSPESRAPSSVIIQCCVCTQDELFGWNSYWQILSLSVCLSSCLHAFLTTHTQTHLPTHM